MRREISKNSVLLLLLIMMRERVKLNDGVD